MGGSKNTQKQKTKPTKAFETTKQFWYVDCGAESYIYYDLIK